MVLRMARPDVTFTSEQQFSKLQYKMICEGKVNGILPCKNYYRNGVLSILYLNAGRSNISKGFHIEGEKSISLICTALDTLLDVEKNGFLRIDNIFFDIDNVYYDEDNNCLQFIYLPIEKNELTDEVKCWKLCRKFLIELLKMTDIINYRIGKICMTYLEEKESNLVDTLQFIKKSIQNIEIIKPMKIILSPVNQLWSQNIISEKEQYVIGRNKRYELDYYLNYETISGEHCKLITHDEHAYLCDLNSRNGTFLNRERLVPYNEYMIKEKDIVGIANIEFEVRIEK